MRVDEAMKEVRRLVWVADLDHRQIAAIEVVCAALAVTCNVPASGQQPNPELPVE